MNRMSYTDCFQIDATLIANEFLDRYMPGANGDYVKVYLYLLRNHVSGVDVESIAEHLQLTEGDVRRAIQYWQKQGIVAVGGSDAEKPAEAGRQASGRSAGKKSQAAGAGAGNEKQEAAAMPETPVSEDSTLITRYEELRSYYSKTEGKEALDRLAADDEFGELLFIVQNYRKKNLTARDQEVLAYLYDGLHLPCDVLEYLVAYCVGIGHNSMRYIEKVGLDWATLGIRTVQAAKERTQEFDRQQKSAAANRSSARTSSRTASQGITRGTDYDVLLKQLVKRKMM